MSQGWPDGQYSFAGSDIDVTYVSHDTNGLSRVLTNLQTISISTHSEVYPVRRLGERSPHGYARGIRTIAGTMIFLLRGNDPFLREVINSSETVEAHGAYEIRRCYIELIPKFDIIVKAVNEVVATNVDNKAIHVGTQMYVSGIVLAETGVTLSTHDVYTELTYTYVAEFVRPFASTIPIEEIKRLTMPKSIDSASISQLVNKYSDDLIQFNKIAGKVSR